MQVLSGPNVFATERVVVAKWRAPVRDPGVPASIERRLNESFPGWLDGCPAGRGLSTEHELALLAARWARGLLNSAQGMIECAGAGMRDGEVFWWVGCHVPRFTMRAMELAACVVTAPELPSAVDESLAGRVVELTNQFRVRHPDAIARVLMLGARTLDLPVLPAAAGPRHWQFGWGARSRVFFETSSCEDSALGFRLGRHKVVAHEFLERLGYPTTQQHSAHTLESAAAHAARLGWPVVVKPSDQGQGRGVTVGVDSLTALASAFAHARSHSSGPVLVERLVPGVDHRLLVVRGQLAAAVRREPATVTGDGRQTVAELIDALNRHRQAQPLLARYLKQITRSKVIDEHLARQGLAFDSVLPPGRRVTLRGNANVSTGGTPTDVTACVHHEVRAMAEAIAANVGLHAVGIDYLTTDIGASLRDAPGAVIEINATPGLDLHLAGGSFGEEAGGRLLLGEGLDRIPVILVVGSAPGLSRWIEAVKAKQHHWPPGMALIAELVDDCESASPMSTEAPSDLRSFGTAASTRPGPSVQARVERSLLDRRCAGLIVAMRPDTIRNGGMPVDRCVATAWIADPADETRLEVRDLVRRSTMPGYFVDGSASGPTAGQLSTVLKLIDGQPVDAASLGSPSPVTMTASGAGPLSNL